MIIMSRNKKILTSSKVFDELLYIKYKLPTTIRTQLFIAVLFRLYDKHLKVPCTTLFEEFTVTVIKRN